MFVFFIYSMAVISLRWYGTDAAIDLNRNMNGKQDLVKFFILALLQFVEPLPFPSNLDLQPLTPVESEVCVYNDIIYPAGQNFTSTNPCETCICEPPKYTCTVKNCLLRVGCKALHLANECCPQYVCDCEKNGRRYANGEKVDEANPCKVCYCTGGDIKCNLVECYSRSDCEPIYVPGRCCPKYDHCPPLEKMRNIQPRMKGTNEPEVVETTPYDVTNGSIYSSASVKMATVPTLEIFEIHPTDATVFQKNQPEYRESPVVFEPELEGNVTESVADVTSASLDTEYASATEETENGRETTTDDESSTLVTWKEAEESSGAELET